MARKFHYNQLMVKIALDELLSKKPKEVEEMVKAGGMTCMEYALTQQVREAIVGDLQALNFCLDRMIGKVKDKLEVKQPTPTVIKRRSGEMLELGTKMDEDNE